MTGHRNVEGTTRDDDACEKFWTMVEPLFAADDVEEGTIMHFPCLRAGGEFFGMPHHSTGELVAKLPASRVSELVAEGVGQPFGPGQKVFKEWVLVGHDHDDRWLDLLAEAKAFVHPA